MILTKNFKISNPEFLISKIVAFFLIKNLVTASSSAFENEIILVLKNFVLNLDFKMSLKRNLR